MGDVSVLSVNQADADDDRAHDRAHDHAWRKVVSDGDSYGTLGAYRCDLCPATWAM
jgi:hypothetical protein